MLSMDIVPMGTWIIEVRLAQAGVDTGMQLHLETLESNTKIVRKNLLSYCMVGLIRYQNLKL